MVVPKPDYMGWATKAGIKCTDGRVIMQNAFEHQDKVTVPLVYMHGHTDIKNVLGHAVLENKPEGVRSALFFNSSPEGQHANLAVGHGDLNSLSIWANNLVEKMVGGVKQVLHGSIKEVSLVLSGANSGARIDPVMIQHGDNPDDWETAIDEGIIFTGEVITHVDGSEITHDAASTGTGASGTDISDPEAIWASMSEEMKALVENMLGQAVEEAAAAHSDEGKTPEELKAEADAKKTPEELKAEEDAKSAADKTAAGTATPPVTTPPTSEGTDLEHKEGNTRMNVFQTMAGVDGGGVSADKQVKLPGDQVKTLIHSAMNGNLSLRSVLNDAFDSDVIKHDGEYGVTNIDALFPDFQKVTTTPDWISRRQEWVNVVLGGASKRPFNRIKSWSADITHDEARAKGYIKATMKKEEFFAISSRTTTAKTVYKKQKLDRDDIIDITDFDVVAWIKGEMRLMLDEEVARAALIGDGREVDDPDKIDETCIRPIAFDDDFYTHKVVVAADIDPEALIEAVLRARPNYRGVGNPTAFMTEDVLTDMLLVKDGFKRRLYQTPQDVAVAMRASNIVTVPVMEDVQTDLGELQIVLVNMSDYTFGSTAGGEISMFDFFDIDFNQNKYLIETRLAGALTRYKTAMAIIRANGTEATPTVPSFAPTTGVVTIPAVTGVKYYNETADPTHASQLSSGAQTAIASHATVTIVAVPAANYYFPHNFDADWDYTRTT